MGDDGHEISEFMFTLMNDERARNADRIEAAKWLADRGFGKAALVINAGVTAEALLQDFFMKLSLEDLETIQAILEKYSRAELAEAEELRLNASPIDASSRQR